MLTKFISRFGQILVSLAYLLLMLLISQLVSTDYHTDGLLYNGIAQAILEGSGTIGEDPNVRGVGQDIGAVIMPGYPALIALIYWIAGVHFWAVITFQLILSGIALLVFHRLNQKLFSPLLAMLVAIWLLVYLPLWKHNFQFLMETVTASLLIFQLYTIWKDFQKNSNTSALLSGISWGILIAVNNRFIFHAFLFFVFLSIIILLKKYSSKSLILQGSMLFLILLPWHIRQYIVYDELMLFSPVRNTQAVAIDEDATDSEFLDYEEYKAYLTKGGLTFANSDQYIQLFTEDKFSRMKAEYNQSNGFQKYWSRARGFFELFRTDFRFGFGGNTTRILPPTIYGKIQIGQMVFNVTLLLPMFLGLIPAVYFAIRHNQYFILSLIILFLAHVLLHSLVHYYYRYRVTILPVLFIAGWYGIISTYRWLLYKKHAKTHG